MQYFGGKSRISKHIASELNKMLLPSQTFVDLFCGSCNVVEKIDKNRTIIANDKHPYLIAMFKGIQEGWLPPDTVSQDEYYGIKSNQNKDMRLSGFVGFACSYSGKWWGGYARNSRGDNFCLQSKNSLVRKLKNLQCVNFYNKDYQHVHIPKNSLVYCDIPYKNTTKYSKVLGNFSHSAFYKWVKKNKDDFTVVVSEYEHNAPPDFNVVWRYESNKEIRNSKNVREKTVEVLLTL